MSKLKGGRDLSGGWLILLRPVVAGYLAEVVGGYVQAMETDCWGTQKASRALLLLTLLLLFLIEIWNLSLPYLTSFLVYMCAYTQ